jgi:hypothetical protein
LAREEWGMSTQEERLRSLREARELLMVVAQEQRLSMDLRRGAQAALNGFPHDVDIAGWLEGTTHTPTGSWGVAFAAGRLVLEVLQRTLPVDDSLRRWADFAERHFPEAIWLPDGRAGSEKWAPMFLDPFRIFRQVQKD